MLIADNQQLSQKVAILLKEKLENERQTQNNDEQGKEADDLRRQVALLIKERDSLHILWQTSQKTIDALETELKAYQCYDNRSPQNNISEENKELELKLETALTDYIELETKYKELKTKHNALENDMKKEEKQAASYRERGKEIEQKLNDSMKTLEEYKINLSVEKKRNEDLKNQLGLSQKECADRLKKESEAKSKVAEALQLYDSVVVQKNQMYKTVQELTSELVQLKHTLSNVRRDMESSCRKEMDEVKEKYNEKIADMLVHIRNLDTELVEKGLLLNKALRENKILQETNESFMKQHKENLKSLDPKLAVAEKRLEAMFQELVSSERRNIQLVCEKQCLAIDIQRIQDIYSREVKRRDWEEGLLKTQCEELKVQVEHLQKSLEETHQMVNKLQNMLASRTELNQKIVSSKEEELIELNKHLENQIELSKKWKESYLEMSDKLKKRLKDLQKENNELRRKLNLPHSNSPEDSTSS
ncbi:rho-associated protein kinase 2-like isoform X2 [Manduca sexta]|nr:rho-associated protein kinase 2-like isoform X2 [Manduca sexta]